MYIHYVQKFVMPTKTRANVAALFSAVENWLYFTSYNVRLSTTIVWIVVVFAGYGLTESSPLTHANPPSGNKYDTIGVAVANVEYKVTSFWLRLLLFDCRVLIKHIPYSAQFSTGAMIYVQVFDRNISQG